MSYWFQKSRDRTNLISYRQCPFWASISLRRLCYRLLFSILKYHTFKVSKISPVYLKQFYTFQSAISIILPSWFTACFLLIFIASAWIIGIFDGNKERRQWEQENAEKHLEGRRTDIDCRTRDQTLQW